MFMTACSDYPNLSSRAFVRITPGAMACELSQNANMPKQGNKSQSDFGHTWYPKEWMRHAGKKQADLGRDLSWPKAKVSAVLNGQPYRQELIDDLAPYFGVQPFELLMPPSVALAYRALASSASRIAAELAAPGGEQLRTGSDR